MFSQNVFYHLALALLCIAAGCEKRSAVAQNSSRSSQESMAQMDESASADDVTVEEVTLTPEQRKAQEMRGCLDEGDYDRAIVLARGLMDSKDVSVRENVVLVLGWIGRRALPELTEMLRDPESEIAQDALVAWENACEEYPSEKVRAELIAKSVKDLEDAAIIDVMLMHFVSLDEQVAIDALKNVIVGCSGRVPASRAKEMYEHISGTVYAE